MSASAGAVSVTGAGRRLLGRSSTGFLGSICEEAEPAVDEKWVLQAFIWSHERLHWPAILDDENLEPDGPLSSSRL